MSKVNAEIIDIEGYGMVIRATKPIDADGEIFISFGRCFWIYYFTRFSDLSPEQQLLQKRANSCYNIEDELVKGILELNIYICNYFLFFNNQSFLPVQFQVVIKGLRA